MGANDVDAPPTTDLVLPSRWSHARPAQQGLWHGATPTDRSPVRPLWCATHPGEVAPWPERVL